MPSFFILDWSVVRFMRRGFAVVHVSDQLGANLGEPKRAVAGRITHYGPHPEGVGEQDCMAARASCGPAPNRRRM